MEDGGRAPLPPAPSIGSGVAAAVHPAPAAHPVIPPSLVAAGRAPSVGSGVAAVVPQTPPVVSQAAGAVGRVATGVSQALPRIAPGMGYPQAIRDVFNAQSVAQKGALIRTILATPDLWRSTEGSTVLAAWRAEPASVKVAIAPYLKQTNPIQPNTHLGVGGAQGVQIGTPHPLGQGIGGGLLGHIASSVTGALDSGLSDVGKALTTHLGGSGGGGSDQGGGGLLGTASMFAPEGGAKSAGQFFGNAGTDLVNFVPNTVQGLYKIGSDVAGGHFGRAAGDVVNPLIQTAEHPVSDFYKTPFTTAAILAGGESSLGRGVGSVMRSGILGTAAKDLAGTAREPLAIGMIGDQPSPLTPLARSYSRNVLTKAATVAWENHLRRVGLDPNIARPLPDALEGTPLAHATIAGLTAKLTRQIDEMVGVRQMAGRAERARVTQILAKERPHATVANVVSHILKGVIRSPETAVADIKAEIQRLETNASKARITKRLSARLQLRDLHTALNNPDHLHEAFDTAAKIRPVIHSQDATHISHGHLAYDQAVRSRLFSYAQAHMKAKYNFTRQRLENADGSTLHTSAILDHVDGWRNVSAPNPDHAAATSARGDAFVKHGDAAAAHAAAVKELQDATVERDSLGQTAKPTAAEAATIARVEALRDRPGSTGEGAAAQSALDRIWARISKRGGGDPAKVSAAERRLADATAGKARSRRDLQSAAARLRQAEAKLRNTPPTATIRVHSGISTPDPAFVADLPHKAAPFNFYKAYRLSRGTIGAHAKTGEAFRTGNYDHTYAGLIGQVANAAEAVTRTELHDRMVQQMAILKPIIRMVNGKWQQVDSEPFRSGEEADNFAHWALHEDNHERLPGRLELTKITLGPRASYGTVKDLQRPNVLDLQPGHELDALKAALADAEAPGANNIGLVPKIAYDRMVKQFEKQGGRRIGKITQQFRKTVLPYSTHWMGQIATEALLRGTVAGVFDPRNFLPARALMHELLKTPEGRRNWVETTGATMFNSHKDLGIHSANQGIVVSAAKAFPPTRLLIGAHNAYSNGVSAAMSSLEHFTRQLGMGKLARMQIQEFTGKYQYGLRVEGDVIKMLAGKLNTDPALVAKFGRSIDDTFGQYNKLTPGVRAAVQSYAPFLPWYLNAAKFVLWTLPVKHPVASALMASLRQTVTQDVQDGKQLPMNAFLAQQIARVTPFGIFNAPTQPGPGGVLADLMDTASSTFLPQIMGAYNASKGLNAFGDGPLTSPHGDVKGGTTASTTAAIETFLESLLPGLSKIREAREGGQPSYGTSNVIAPEPKPGGDGGNLGEVLNRAFNPAYAAERAAANPPKTGGSGGGGNGLGGIGSSSGGGLGSVSGGGNAGFG